MNLSFMRRSKQQQQMSSSERESELAAENVRLKRQLAEQAENWPSSKGRDILRESPEMKYVFIENHRAEFCIKAMCRVLRVARSGWYVWLRRRHQMSLRQQFRLTCDAAVHKAFFEAKQRYGAPRLADELPEFNIKTIAASLRRQGLRAKVQPGQLPCTWPARIGESAGAGLQRQRPEPEVGG